MRKRDRNVALGTLIAAGIGYAAGLLSAPKSGRETRRDIQATAVRARKQAEKNFKDLHSELSLLIDTGAKEARNLSAKAQKEYDDALNAAQAAKEKARHILSSIHEGDTDDHDLQAAIGEVKNAVNHLKKYAKHVSETKKEV